MAVKRYSSPITTAILPAPDGTVSAADRAALAVGWPLAGLAPPAAEGEGDYYDAAVGLKTVLEANITGLHAFFVPPESINEFPAAVILPEVLDPEIMFKGNTFTAAFRVVLLLSSGDTAEGFLALYDYVDPTETGKSVIAAVNADNTLNGEVDDAQVVSVENMGWRELYGPGGGRYFGLDAVVEFIKTVA